MRILYLGDIVGEKTIDVLAKCLDDIKKENKINMVLVNAENVTSGKGLSQKHYNRKQHLCKIVIKVRKIWGIHKRKSVLYFQTIKQQKFTEKTQIRML